jgi:hypothetical protein
LKIEIMNTEKTPQSCQTDVSGSFYSGIQLSNDRMFYAKLIKEYGKHEVGRIYYISKQHDNTLYSGDSRGIGQGGYVSNVIDSYFEKSTKEDYDSQNCAVTHS